MHWSDIPFDPPRNTLRQFAALWVVFFGGMALWQGLARGHVGQALIFGLLAVTIGALAGCAATGPLSGDPCWGFFACTGWH